MRTRFRMIDGKWTMVVAPAGWSPEDPDANVAAYFDELDKAEDVGADTPPEIVTSAGSIVFDDTLDAPTEFVATGAEDVGFATTEAGGDFSITAGTFTIEEVLPPRNALEAMNRDQVRAAAKEAGIKNVSARTKGELIELLVARAV